MERRLSLLPDLGYEEEPVQDIRIAVTTFAFKNHEIINLLKKRGEIIKAEDWDEMAVMDDKINKLKNDQLEELTTPCSAFMTFENEEGVNRALKYKETVENDDNFAELRTWLGDHKIEIEPASEPTDIIWENRHYTPMQRLKKSIIATLIILLLLFISFIMIFICSNFSVNAILKYPTVDCTNLTEL